MIDELLPLFIGTAKIIKTMCRHTKMPISDGKRVKSGESYCVNYQALTSCIINDVRQSAIPDHKTIGISPENYLCFKARFNFIGISEIGISAHRLWDFGLT